VTVSDVPGTKDWVNGVALARMDATRYDERDKTATVWDVSAGAPDTRSYWTLYGIPIRSMAWRKPWTGPNWSREP